MLHEKTFPYTTFICDHYIGLQTQITSQVDPRSKILGSNFKLSLTEIRIRVDNYSKVFESSRESNRNIVKYKTPYT